MSTDMYIDLIHPELVTLNNKLNIVIGKSLTDDLAKLVKQEISDKSSEIGGDVGDTLWINNLANTCSSRVKTTAGRQRDHGMTDTLHTLYDSFEKVISCRYITDELISMLSHIWTAYYAVVKEVGYHPDEIVEWYEIEDYLKSHIGWYCVCIRVD